MVDKFVHNMFLFKNRVFLILWKLNLEDNTKKEKVNVM